MVDEDLRRFVQARLVEAAATECRLPAARTRPATAKAFWPETGFSADDFDGWTAETKAEYLDAMAKTRGAPAAAVTRYEQALAWLIVLVSRAEERKAAWAWARSKAGGLSFRKWASHQPLDRKVYRRRASAAIDQIAGHLGNEQVFLAGDICSEVSPIEPEYGSDLGKLDEERPMRSPAFHREPGAVPKAVDETDPDAVKAMLDGIEAANARGARQREVMRRRLLGLEEA